MDKTLREIRYQIDHYDEVIRFKIMLPTAHGCVKIKCLFSGPQQHFKHSQDGGGSVQVCASIFLLFGTLMCNCSLK